MCQIKSTPFQDLCICYIVSKCPARRGQASWTSASRAAVRPAPRSRLSLMLDSWASSGLPRLLPWGGVDFPQSRAGHLLRRPDPARSGFAQFAIHVYIYIYIYIYTCSESHAFERVSVVTRRYHRSLCGSSEKVRPVHNGS